MVGLAALVVCIVGLAIGIWRNERRSPYAVMGLTVFGLMSFSDLPSNFPMVLAIGVCWAALAAPRIPDVAIAAADSRPRWPVVLSRAIGAVILVAVASTMVAWAAYDAARAHLNSGDRDGARRALDQAVALDPSLALYRRVRGTLAQEAGAYQAARSDLERALQLNSGDASTLRGLAVLAYSRGHPEDAVQFARRAVSLRPTSLNNELMLAWVATRIGERQLATRAFISAVMWYPWAAAAPTWTAVFGPVTEGVLKEAASAWDEHDGDRRREAIWLKAMTGARSSAGLAPSSAAVNAIIRCDPAQAAEELADSGGVAHDRAILIPQFMLASLLDDENAFRVALAAATLVRSDFVNLAVRDPGPASPFSDYEQDIRLYKRIPFPPTDIEPMLPTQAEGLSAWLRDPAEAARRSAPGSALADCGI